MDFQDLDPDDISAADEAIALDLERRGGLESDRALATKALADIDPARADEVRATIEAGSEGP
jgi:hypothetical protein